LESSALQEVNVHGQSLEGPNISGPTAEGSNVGSGRGVQGGGGPSGSVTHDSNVEGPNEEGTSGHRQSLYFIYLKTKHISLDSTQLAKFQFISLISGNKK